MTFVTSGMPHGMEGSGLRDPDSRSLSVRSMKGMKRLEARVLGS